MIGWIKIVAVALMIAAPATARSPADLDALATLRYKSAQTETVAARVADARLVAMRAQITTGDAQLVKTRNQLAQLRTAGKADKAKIAALEQQTGTLLTELARLKTDFTDELAKRDAQYARDIAILQSAGEQLLATPDGARALALYNEGGPGAFEAADAVLAQVEKARDEARVVAAKKQLAADRRARATLAVDARDKGMTTTAVAIDRWKAVVEADPGSAFDWADLADLYITAGQLDPAMAAARSAGQYATTDRETQASLNKVGDISMLRGDLGSASSAFRQTVDLARKRLALYPRSFSARRDLSLALYRLGDTLTARNDLSGALAADEESLTLTRAMVAASPGSILAQGDLLTALLKVGAIRAMLGDLPGALSANQESLDIARTLATRNPASALAQRDLMVSLEKVGDIHVAQRDLPGALALYEEALALARKLLVPDPSFAQARRDLSVELNKVGDVQMARRDPASAVTVYRESLEIRRALAAASPDSAAAKRDVGVNLNRVGDALVALNDRTGVLPIYQESLVLFRSLAALDPGSAVGQRDVFVGLWKLAGTDNSGVTWNDVVAQLEMMKARGLLAPLDEPSLAKARARAVSKE